MILHPRGKGAYLFLNILNTQIDFMSDFTKYLLLSSLLIHILMISKYVLHYLHLILFLKDFYLAKISKFRNAHLLNLTLFSILLKIISQIYSFLNSKYSSIYSIFIIIHSILIIMLMVFFKSIIIIN